MTSLRTLWYALFALSPLIKSVSAANCTSPQHYADHPVLCRMLSMHITEFAPQAHEYARETGHLVDMPVVSDIYTPMRQNTTLQSSYPVVLAHGMGDSCYNPGMQHMVDYLATKLQALVFCIALGSSQEEDTRNGYFLNMDASVDLFAEQLQELFKGHDYVHAMGFSQGNNVIRGYIARYNDVPKIHTFISINGVNAGVGAVPYCRPDSLVRTERQLRTSFMSMCDLLMEQASNAAYTDFAQQNSFQANYWRDPRPGKPYQKYLQYAQLALWNNEILQKNETLKYNWSQTQRFVWILATEDQMVWPCEGEHWGVPDPNDPFHSILSREHAPWFTEDWFGLRTAEEAGKNHYEHFEGDHLQFSQDDLDRWLETYIS